MDGVKLHPNSETRWNAASNINEEEIPLKYMMTEPLAKWVLLYPQKNSVETFKDFVEKIQTFGAAKGMEIHEPEYIKFEDKTDVWLEVFSHCKQDGHQLIMLIDPKVFV